MFLPRVIAALADDERAPDVLATARGLAAETGEPVVAIHAVRHAAPAAVPLSGASAAAVAQAADDPASWRAAHRAARELLEDLGVAPEERVVLDGDPAEVLAALAAEHDGALVVCGARGHGPVAGWLLGSTSQDVLRHVDAPVVLVGPRATMPTTVRRVVCAVDGARLPAQAAWRVAAELAGRLRCELHAAGPSPAGPLAASARDVLVVARPGQGGLRERLGRDAVVELVRHAPAPVLVAPAPRPEPTRAH